MSRSERRMLEPLDRLHRRDLNQHPSEEMQTCELAQSRRSLMKRTTLNFANLTLALTLIALLLPFNLQAQQSSGQSAVAGTMVPRLMRFSGVVPGAGEGEQSGVMGIEFALYAEATGGSPLWMETQNVRPDASGHYSVLLGSTTVEGLPANVFTSEQAHWVGVRISGQEEQPRVMLLAVPYALKAADAETIGGLPPSAFMLAPVSGSTTVINQTSSSTTEPPPASSNVTTTGGTVNAIPLFSTTTNIQNSILTQTATTAINVAGKLNLPALGLATATAGKNSRPEAFVASAFNSGTATAVPQTFVLQAEPAGNNTATASGTLNLLHATGTATPTETGLKISSTGLITFATGQKFPGTGAVTGVTAGADLTGGGTSGNVTLNVDTTKVPLLAAANTFTGNQSITGNLTASGSVNALSGSFNGASTSTTYLLNVTQTSNSAQAMYVNSAGLGVYSYAANGDGLDSVSDVTYGVLGVTHSNNSPYPEAGVYGAADEAGNYGVLAYNYSTAGQGLWAETVGTAFSQNAGSDAVHGIAHSNAGSGVAGFNDAAGGIAVYGQELAGGGSYAGRFDGNVWVNGNLSKNGGSFKIDHPLDPSNKYLYHSFVESPDMKNIYDGVAVLDANGEAVVTMPEWFDALNRDFRYQLTCIGGFAPVYISEEVANNHFKVSGGQAGMKVSWQVTGTRQDAWANAHRIPVEEIKPNDERGTYLHPELFGAPETSAVGWGRYRFANNTRQRPPRIPSRSRIAHESVPQQTVPAKP